MYSEAVYHFIIRFIAKAWKILEKFIRGSQNAFHEISFQILLHVICILYCRDFWEIIGIRSAKKI
jgi:hypothetical protein